VSEFAFIHNLDDDDVWTAGGTNAKPRLEFTASDPDSGDSVASVILRIYTAVSGGSPDTGGTHTLTGSTLVTALANGYYDSTYGMKNANQASSERWWTIEAIDGTGESTGESTPRRPFKVNWGQAIYQYELGAGFGPPSWDYATIPPGTQAAFLFANAAVDGGSRTDWQPALSAIPNDLAYMNVLVRLSTHTVGEQPALAYMSVTYQGTAQQPDNWTHFPSGQWSLDLGGQRRFGSKAFRCVVGEADYHYCEPFRLVESPADGIEVMPNTDYVFSAHVRTMDPPGPLTADHVVRLQVATLDGLTNLAYGSLYGDDYYLDGPGATLDSGALLNGSYIYPEGWQRLLLHFRTPANVYVVRPSIVYTKPDGSAPDDTGDVFWVDGTQWEEGTVVSPWTPGFVSHAIAMDAWGIRMNGEQGAQLDLVHSDGVQTADIDALVEAANGAGGGGSALADLVYFEPGTDIADLVTFEV
jgi:hypothetical protein